MQHGAVVEEDEVAALPVMAVLVAAGHDASVEGVDQGNPDVLLHPGERPGVVAQVDEAAAGRRVDLDDAVEGTRGRDALGCGGREA